MTDNALDTLYEAATQAFKRKNQQITRYYRCTSGPKKGKLASDPSKCGQRPDPKKVRHGRRVAKQKGAVRVRKTMTAKRQQLSKRITQLNKNLRDRRKPSKPKNESFTDFLSRANTQTYDLTRLSEAQLDLLLLSIDKCEQYVESGEDCLTTGTIIEQYVVINEDSVQLCNVVSYAPGDIRKQLISHA